MKKLLPQANSIDTIVDTFIFLSTYNEINVKTLSEFCHFDQRQSSYYMNACFYLNLIDEKKKLTELGRKIVSSGEIKLQIYLLMLQDSLISKVFAYKLLKPNGNSRQYCKELIKQEYPNYSEAVVVRRTSTVLAWIKQIKDFINKIN